MMKIHEAMKTSLVLAAQVQDAKKRLEIAGKSCPSHDAHEASELALEKAEAEHERLCTVFTQELSALPEYAAYIELEQAMQRSKRGQLDALRAEAIALAAEMYPDRPELQKQ